MNFKNKLFIFFLFLVSLSVNSQKLWNNISKSVSFDNKSIIYEKKHTPTEYKIFFLNSDKFYQNLNFSRKNKSIELELPDSDGNLKRFMLIKSSNFEIGLQNKFPEIQSFSAIGIEDPSLTAKISIGIDGLHAVIHSNNSPTTYIDPYTKDKKYFITYKRSSLPKVESDFKCMVEGDVKAHESQNSYKLINDGKLRTYRLAIVCSGEYAQFHLNRQGIPSSASDTEKKSAVLSAMNTSLTRINGVFEKDLGIKMVIVEDNDKIIFLDSTTDNITDGNAGVMINEVQSICDSEIGNANYDIGHIFSIGGSGLAGLGVVCQSGSKARGVTGISSPVSDPYDIDYVAHEIGHQFGATHTQNNSCNRTLSTAVEVGSGSTIMGYAGICAPNVIGVGPSTGSSDDYFHTVSITQMQNYITSFANCAELTDTNNSTPTADAGLDFVVPASTPFKLTGIATDADENNSLSFNWEQIDNEIGIMPPSSTNEQGPMFRSLPSKSVPYRYFPEISTIIDGGNSNTWEVLPSVGRELNFAFTVRDNNEGGGSTARDDMKVTVIDGDAFEITSQTTNVTWDTGSTQTINWNVSETNQSPINCSLVNIKLSTDGGETFPITLKSNTPNDGVEELIVPNNPSENARIMVEAVENIFFNINSGDININSTVPTFIIVNSSGVQSACNIEDDSAVYKLDFDFVNGFSETVSLSATNLPQGSQVSFSSSTIDQDGSVMMTLSNFSGIDADDYIINVDAVSSSVEQNIDIDLKLTSSNFENVNLQLPADGDTNTPISVVLEWDNNQNAISYDVEIAADTNFSDIVSFGEEFDNDYIATNLDAKTQYFWRVRPKNNCGQGEFSKAFSFTTIKGSYCESNFTEDPKEYIKNVSFNTINNDSGNDLDDGYENFTSIRTDVKRGDTHELIVVFDTDGYQDNCIVYIDWNRDFVFDTENEMYDLGTGFDDESTLSSDITIPNDARLGETRMRIVIEYTNSGSHGIGACDSDHNSEWGETEDYTINIQEATASIEDVSFNNFNLFPNPNSGLFTLMFEADSQGETVLELYDLSGRIVSKRMFSINNLKFKENIDVKDLSKGIYLLKIKNGEKQTTRKLIIK